MNNIIIAFSEIEKPLRDYYIDVGDKVSKIGDIEFIKYLNIKICIL